MSDGGWPLPSQETRGPARPVPEEGLRKAGPGFIRAEAARPGPLPCDILARAATSVTRFLLHAQSLKQQIGLLRQRRGVALMHDAAGLQNIDPAGNSQRAVKILLHQKN